MGAPIRPGIVGSMSRIAAPAVALAVALSAVARASEYDFAVAPTSSVVFGAGFTAPLAGTLIGNWDAAANPTGTRTLTGLWGGTSTTNTAIPYTAVLDGGVDASDVPTGGFHLSIPQGGAPATIAGLEFDLLGGEPADILLTIDMVFQTFRTKAPDSVYFGSTALPPIPLAYGRVTDLRIEQCCASEVVATELPGMTVFSGMVQADLVIRATLLSQQIADISVPVMVPVAGMVDPSGKASTASIDFAQGTSYPLPEIPAFENQAVALPTIFPPGNTANLLFSGTIDGPAGTFDVNVDATIDVTGVARTADVNHDGWINGQDLGQMLSMWHTADPACDLDDSGMVDGGDLVKLLNEWRSQ